MRCALIMLLALITAASPAEDYPSFVYTNEAAAPAATPVSTPTTVSADAPTTETPAATPVPTFIEPPRVLVGDLASTRTWTATRARIEPGFEELRVAFIGGAPPDEAAAVASRLLTDLDALVQMAPTQAPNQEDSIVWFESRLRRQILMMIPDYFVGERARIATTDRMVRKSLMEFQSVLERSDRERGNPEVGRRSGLPNDWAEGEPELRDFSAMIAAWTKEQLADEYRLRAITYFDSLKRTKEQELSLSDAREMSALARELATRDYELPMASRQPYRNSALQLDVLAENLHDHLRNGRRLHARRQTRLILATFRQLDSYLELGAMPVPETSEKDENP